MIQRLTLQNFGPFKDLDVTFEEITRIKGDNGSGKSHIFEALDLVLNSKGFPEYFVHNNESFASAKVYLSNGISIERVRNNNIQYALITEGEERKFSNPLQIKEEVGRLTRFMNKQLDVNTEISCQFIPIDADQFFMIEGIAPATVMRRISNLVSGSDFSVARKAVEGHLRDRVAVGKYLQKELKEKGSKFEDLSVGYIEGLNSKFKDLSVLVEDSCTLYEDSLDLTQRLDNLEQLKFSIKKEDFIKADTLYNSYLEIIDTYNVLNEKETVLKKTINTIEDLENRIAEAQKEKDVLFTELINKGNICSLCGGFIEDAR